MSSSVCVKNRGADHRANSGASYAADRLRQALRRSKIRIRDWRLFNSVKLWHRRAVLSLVAKIWGGKPQNVAFLRFFAFIPTFFAVTCASSESHEATAAPPTHTPAVSAELATKLTADLRVSLLDKPLREALTSISDAGRVNIWIDRRVDPTSLISIDASANTVYLALASAARSAGLELHAVQNVILIGRADWVDRTAAAIRNLPRLGEPINVHWRELTTPKQAYLACTPQTEADFVAANALPHDLWPEVKWSDIPVEIGKLLVAAQFDLEPPTSGAGWRPMASAARSGATYPLGKHAKTLRSAVTDSDRSATMKEVDGRLLVTASSETHRIATDAWLRTPSTEAKKVIDIDKIKFTLRLQNAIAEQVLRQLAATSGRKLVIDATVATRCEKAVSLSVQDETLRELALRISNEIEVLVSWTDSELRINARP